MLRQLLIPLGLNRPGAARSIIESMDPIRYLTASYYERLGIEVVEKAALAKGVITDEELDKRTEFFREHPASSVPRREDPITVERVLAGLRMQRHPSPEGPAPRFHLGDPVLVRNLNWSGHSRLPRYIRGKRGSIARVNGWYAIEDDHAEELGPNPQTVYTVEFAGREVWGPNTDPKLKVYLELWEGYLDAP
jgi:nitrile hydratase beta subunit